jgi:hypothetical protein
VSTKRLWAQPRQGGGVTARGLETLFLASAATIYDSVSNMDSALGALPDNIEALKAAMVAARGERIAEAARAAQVEAELAVARAKASDDQALIADQQLQIKKVTRQRPGKLLLKSNDEIGPLRCSLHADLLSR